ncbi:MAG TPA: OmpA family protein [Chitinophagaceae bacterium]|jgi:outer membrane protein OmpA-like peptidoglycan-associated protein
MASNLLDSVRGFITPQLIGQASSYLGESSEGITRAIGGAVPTVLTGLINNAESGGAAALLSNAKEVASSNILGNLGNLFSGSSTLPSGVGSLSSLFGDRLGGMTSALSSFSGIKNSSASSLLGMIVPVILSVIGKHAMDNNLSPAGLSSFLSAQKSSAMDALPSGLNITNLFGSARQAVTGSASELRSAVTPKRTNWLWPILLILLAVILLFYFIRGCNRKPEAAVTPPADTTTTAPTVMDTTAASMPGRESMKVKLADGTEIDAYKGGIEDVLVNCLNDANCKAGKDKWFDFDNINFETGSAAITPESQAQVSNIVAILKAYPKARIKIGGYTDKTGDPAANKTLSQQRAEAVLNAIKAAGANGAQLVGAEGYGSAFAKVPETASDEERKKDRRIAVQLREK